MHVFPDWSLPDAYLPPHDSGHRQPVCRPAPAAPGSDNAMLTADHEPAIPRTYWNDPADHRHGPAALKRTPWSRHIPLSNPDLPAPHFDPGLCPVPEAAAVVDAFKKYQPIWMADFHHQGTYVTDDGESVTSSILWPKNEDVSQEFVDLSKQLCFTIYDHMQQFGFSTITLYNGGTFPGIARNAYGLAGAGSILVELKGGIGQKQSGMIIKHAYEQMWAILEATADGSLEDINPEWADEIPGPDTYHRYYKDLPKGGDDGE